MLYRQLNPQRVTTTDIRVLCRESGILFDRFTLCKETIYTKLVSMVL